MLLSYHNNMICIVFISRTGLCILIQVEITEDNTLYTPSYLPHALLHPHAGPLSWEVPTPASFILSAALLKKACKTFTSSKHPEREKLKQPPTLSILKSLGGTEEFFFRSFFWLLRAFIAVLESVIQA